MPCGGIWTPEPGSHWLAHKCWVCGELGCELFCDEWDTTLHVRCLGKFLETEEGRCMLLHGHGISIPDREDGAGWPGVTVDFGDPESKRVLDTMADALIEPLAIQQAQDDHEAEVRGEVRCPHGKNTTKFGPCGFCEKGID